MVTRQHSAIHSNIKQLRNKHHVIHHTPEFCYSFWFLQKIIHPLVIFVCVHSKENKEKVECLVPSVSFITEFQATKF